MSTPFNLRPGSVNLTGGSEGDATEMPPETPFRLLVIGNFSGNRAAAIPLAQRKPILIDRDNFDEVLAKFASGVTLPGQANGADVGIEIAELDDFEPDRLFRNLSIFEDLRTLLDQVGDTATFPQAAAKIRTWANVPDAEPAPAQKPDADGADVLQQLLDADRAHSAQDEWQVFLNKIAQPHLVEKTDPRQADYALVVEQAIGARCGQSCIIQHFRHWRRRGVACPCLQIACQPRTDFEIHLLDANLDELRTDIAGRIGAAACSCGRSSDGRGREACGQRC